MSFTGFIGSRCTGRAVTAAPNGTTVTGLSVRSATCFAVKLELQIIPLAWRHTSFRTGETKLKRLRQEQLGAVKGQHHRRAQKTENEAPEPVRKRPVHMQEVEALRSRKSNEADQSE